MRKNIDNLIKVRYTNVVTSLKTQEDKHMMIDEFETLTGIYPTTDLYESIEEAYTKFKGGKDEFCKAYKANDNFIAEKIQSAANMKHFDEIGQHAHEINARDAVIKNLKADLEREQEWKLLEDTNNISQTDYAKLAEASDTRIMTDDEAKELLYNQYGFAKEKITIFHEIDKNEVNRHRFLRKVGTICREPLYNATDWNYIRFDCGCMTYELYNDDLRLFVQ